MLYPMKQLVEHALENNYAVIAPSIRNTDCMRAAIEAGEELGSPIIFNLNLGVMGSVIMPDYAKFLVDMGRQYALRTSIPVAINLDHAPTYEACAKGISYGMTSVMIDASYLPLEENIAITRRVVEAAHAVGISVEAEVGHVGVADETKADDSFTATTSWSAYTDPDEFKYFCESTGADCVAISIGNKHGAWAGGVIPHIEFELLSKLRETVPDMPLVLHGGSGTGDENLSRAASMGICKVNVGTELEKGAADAIAKAFECDGKVFGPFNKLREGYKEQVIRHIKLFHGEGKAW